MAFCYKCGTPIAQNANFCAKCGARVPTQENPQNIQPAQPAAQQFTPPSAQPAAPAPLPFDFSRIPVRHVCPNGHVTDSNGIQTVCPSCGAPLQSGGIIQIYRMGSFAGMAVGMGIYIDDVPCGHLGNKQSIRISVPYGAHKVHMTHTTTRACNDPIFNITPEYPYVWCKAHFAAAGFRIAIEPASPDSMPAK